MKRKNKWSYYRKLEKISPRLWAEIHLGWRDSKYFWGLCGGNKRRLQLLKAQILIDRGE